MRLNAVERKREILRAVFFTFIPLLVGGIVYYWLFPEVWFVRFINSRLDLKATDGLSVTDSMFLQFIRNYAFDLLWAFAFANLVCIILSGSLHVKKASLIVPILAGSVLEILQLMGLSSGTFDIWDIFAEGLGTVIAVYTNSCSRREKNEKKQEN